jgi:hypothetical protein
MTTATPDSIDRIISKEIESATGAFVNSPYGKDIADKYSGQITVPTVAGARGTTTLGSSMEFQRGEKLASYAFRNTPISQMFTPEQKQQSFNEFRAGERAPLNIAPATKTTKTGGSGSGVRGVGKLTL